MFWGSLGDDVVNKSRRYGRYVGAVSGAYVCRRCGREFPVDQEVCATCGTPLSAHRVPGARRFVLFGTFIGAITLGVVAFVAAATPVQLHAAKYGDEDHLMLEVLLAAAAVGAVVGCLGSMFIVAMGARGRADSSDTEA